MIFLCDADTSPSYANGMTSAMNILMESEIKKWGDRRKLVCLSKWISVEYVCVLLDLAVS